MISTNVHVFIVHRIIFMNYCGDKPVAPTGPRKPSAPGAPANPLGPCAPREPGSPFCPGCPISYNRKNVNQCGEFYEKQQLCI